jgi:signal transduction histidine kinase
MFAGAFLAEWYVAVSWVGAVTEIQFVTAENALSTFIFMLAPGILVVVAMAFALPFGSTWLAWALLSGGLALAADAVRTVLQVWYWGPTFLGGPTWGELGVGLVVPWTAMLAGVGVVQLQRETARAERAASQAEIEAQQALLELEGDELRIRREISDELHGRLQQRLVFLASALEEIVPMAQASNDDKGVKALRDVIEMIDDVREVDVRRLSHTLFPVGVDIGLHQAIRLMMGRVPAHIELDFAITDAAAEVDSVTSPEFEVAERVLLAEILEEGLTNAIKHGLARSLRVKIDLVDIDGRESLRLRVENDGRPLGEHITFSGLARYQARAEARGGGLTLKHADDGWVSLCAWLPRHEAVQDPPSP